MANGKSLVLGILIGGLAGSAAVLMTAPKSGHELRETICANSKKVKDTVKTIKTESTQLKNQVIQISKEGAIVLKDFSNDLKTTVDTWKKEIEPNKDAIMEELKNIEESIHQLENISRK